MQAPNAPTPGSTTPAARSIAADVARDLGAHADALEALLHAAQVAHAVVDDRDCGHAHSLTRRHGETEDRDALRVSVPPW